MDMIQVGNFNVWRHGDDFANQAMLLTHGGYYPKDGMEGMNCSVYFYAPHTVSILFSTAFDVIRNTGSSAATAISGPSSPVWNYTLQTLKGQQAVDTLDAWQNQQREDKWDWWEVEGDQLQTLSTLKAAIHSRGHSYTAIHFLCCRAWMPADPPQPVGRVNPPKEEHTVHHV